MVFYMLDKHEKDTSFLLFFILNSKIFFSHLSYVFELLKVWKMKENPTDYKEFSLYI